MIFDETEFDRRAEAWYRERADRTAAAVDRLGAQRHTPQIVIFGAIFMWAVIAVRGGSYFEHAVAAIMSALGCFLLFIKPGQVGQR